MPTVAIIGASRGIGLELARQYAEAGWGVHATHRHAGGLPRALAALGSGVTWHRLDVRDPGQLEALRAQLADAPLDVLIHNAGVAGRGEPREEVMAVNAEAPLAVVTALLDAVARGAERKVVIMTSQLGARRGRTGSLGVYGDSKAALNDRFRELEPSWRARGVIAIVMHPGWVRTDMGGRGATLSVEESVSGVRRVIEALTPADAGRFLTWEGEEHPW